MAAISQNFPNAYRDLSLQPSLAAPVANSEQDLRGRLESALQEITREFRAYPVDNFTNELQVWAINFSYYLTLDTPEEGLKTYIPLLEECLQKCAYPSHPAYILMSTWLKNPDFQAVASQVKAGKKAHVLKQGHVLETGDVGFIYPSFLAKISKKAHVVPSFPITEVPTPICHEFRNFHPSSF